MVEISTFQVSDHVLRVVWEANMLEREHGRLHIVDKDDIPILSYRKILSFDDARTISMPKSMDYSWLNARERFKTHCDGRELPESAWASLAEQSQKAILKRTPWNIELSPGIGVDTHSELMQSLASMYIGAMLTKSGSTLLDVILVEPMIQNEYLDGYYQFRNYPDWHIVLTVEEQCISISLDTKNRNYLLRRNVDAWGPSALSLTSTLFGFPDDNAYLDWKDLNVRFSFEEYQMNLILVRDPMRALQICYTNSMKNANTELSVDGLFHT